MPLRALVIDDEALARQRVLDFISQDNKVTSVGEFEDPLLAIEAIIRERPDLIFLDVQMPELDGFAVLDAVRHEYLPAVIFITAHDQHAVHAFEIQALDYLLKPFNKRRLHQAVARVLDRNNDAMRAAINAVIEQAGRDNPYPEKLPVKINGRIVIISTEKIEWIEAERDYIRLHVAKDSYLVRGSMASIESKLCGKKFVRIHRSTIINLDYLAELRPTPSGEYLITLSGGTQLRLSRSHRENLPQIIPSFSFRKSEEES